ncbi:MAG: hypothetical protein Q8N62_03225 [Candidatus Omnitrophota bacterium]|nr:hypothetical protein [Candidatus Omnitrophota bacterium]
MDNPDQQKWYFKTWPLVASFLCIGPFMLPLVWTNPRFSKKSKIIITIAVAVITIVMVEFLIASLKTTASYYQI